MYGSWLAWIVCAGTYSGCAETRGGGVKPGRRETTSSYYPHTCYGADRRGGVAGAEPPHKGGPNRPDRPELQWSVVSGQWSVVREIVCPGPHIGNECL